MQLSIAPLSFAILAFGTFALWCVLSIDWILGIRTMAFLEPCTRGDGVHEHGGHELGGHEQGGHESVSVVIPARNEASALPAALASVLAQELPVLQVIVVDDRSEDDTGAVAAAVGAGDARLVVERVDVLPPGWLGKTNAMAEGAARASGSWLLFTDADVCFAPGAVAAAVSYAEQRGVDHLAVLPRFIAPTPLLASFVTTFGLLFTFLTRPWRARSAESTAAIGIGAFALVRRTAYQAIGGLGAVRMSVDDDLSLGRVLKRAGFRQEAAFGADLVAVEWYPDLRSAIHGLEKNAFAGLGFSVWRVGAVVIALIVTNVVPFVLLPVLCVATAFDDAWLWAAIGNALVVSTVALGYTLSAGRFGHRVSSWPYHPVGVLLLCWAVVASAFKALRHGEIEWRGTRYRLRDVRPPKV